MYRTLDNEFTEDEIKHFDYDMLIFSTPTGVQYLNKAFPEFKQGDIKIACFGPATAKAVEEAGLRLDFMAGTKEYPSMVAALSDFLKKSKA